MELGNQYDKYLNGKNISKGLIYKALFEKDYETLRAISEYFYNSNGIYQRICDYFAFMYRYDWYVAAQSIDEEVSHEKILKDYNKILTFLDNSDIKRTCGQMASKIFRYGCYYGYAFFANDQIVIQELPLKYCRSRYTLNGSPAIEFDMRYFDTFSSPAYKMKVLGLFPDEFKKGYILYKQGKLTSDDPFSSNSWYLLDTAAAFKFNFNNNDIPIFIRSIPAIMDLDAAQDLDRRKQMQRLLKILVQKLPLDKNGDLIFDVDEAKDIHTNAVTMLRNAIGVDVLTTFADVEAIDTSDTAAAASVDELEKVERTVYNSFGVSRNIFNSDTNLALEKSILNDESTVRDLLLQFGKFYDKIVQTKGKSRKYNFRFTMLETTQYNYQNLSKLYKEHTMMGCSKLLPQIALGFSQSFILNSIYFENSILNLSNLMIPPITSNTMSGEDLANLSGDNKGGRPELEESKKSDKTLANEESE